MENQRGKGLSFAKRIYKPRIIGLGIGCLSVAAGLYSLSPPAWVWGLLLFNAAIWPHLAFQLSCRSAFPYKAERRNLLIDSLAGGFWAATMHFNPLAPVPILPMLGWIMAAPGADRWLLRGGLGRLGGSPCPGVCWEAVLHSRSAWFRFTPACPC